MRSPPPLFLCVDNVLAATPDDLHLHRDVGLHRDFRFLILARPRRADQCELRVGAEGVSFDAVALGQINVPGDLLLLPVGDDSHDVLEQHRDGGQSRPAFRVIYAVGAQTEPFQ